MKMKIGTFALAGIVLLGGGVAFGNEIGQDKAQKEAKKQMAITSQQATEAKVENMSVTTEPSKPTVPNETTTVVTETFVITGVDHDGFVHGENISGLGEGIYYESFLFWEYMDEFQEGDYVAISWDLDDYLKGEREKVQNIARVIH